MARNSSISAKPMTDGSVPVGTDIREKILDVNFVKDKIAQTATWVAFNADNSQWHIDHPEAKGIDPIETHCAATDPDNPTVKEQLFVEVRMQTVDALSGEEVQENSAWRQVSIVNYPSLNTGSYWTRKKHIYDTEVARAGLAQ